MLTQEQVTKFEGELEVAQEEYRKDLESDRAPELNGGRVAGYSEVLKMTKEGKSVGDFTKRYQEVAELNRKNPSSLWQGMLRSFKEVHGVIA